MTKIIENTLTLNTNSSRNPFPIANPSPGPKSHLPEPNVLE